MTHTCRDCNRTFGSELRLELHKDNCGADMLFCEQCGERFPERTATRDGWHYTCPTDGCDGDGIGEDLYEVDRVRIATR
ncbi:transcriptional regulator [Halorarius halobius]|uniref:transcriptional regulator n=1 Tax=Halorarius halobius TaxID=2962671 RepID=UPI0020CE4680|nr:transcriptional regulator [Halorarius halobius]